MSDTTRKAVNGTAPNPGKSWSGLREDQVEKRKHKLKLSKPRSQYDLDAEKRRKESYDLGTISPLPRDKDGNPSYIPDHRVYEKDDICGPDIKVRSATDKVARQFVRRGQSFADYASDDWSDEPRDPVWRSNAPVLATPRKGGPFKRAGKRAKAQGFVVEHKGRGR